VKVLLDASVLIAAIVRVHPMHWLKRVKQQTDTGIVSAHILAEL
jgi:hypothetical protein